MAAAALGNESPGFLERMMEFSTLNNSNTPSKVAGSASGPSKHQGVVTFESQSVLPVSADVAFNWHSMPGAFERLSPPWQTVQVRDRQGTIGDGDRITLGLKIGPIWRKWIAEHRDYIQGRQFRDVQLKGPFAQWEHTHRFEPIDARSSRLVDHIEYKLPLGWLGRMVGGAHARRTLDAVFAYRHRLTWHDLQLHARHAHTPRLTVAITGASGLIGLALAALLTTGGHRVIKLVRTAIADDPMAALWNGREGLLEPQKLEGVDAIIHLAGENVAGGRWTEGRKKRILESRTLATQSLTRSLSNLKNPPRIFIGASAIGYYGDGGQELLDESSANGSGFLAQVCKEWEQATEPAKDLGLRVVNARIGVVLTPRGGALAKMLLPFKLGAGGPIGSGRQFMSWISLDDVVAGLHHLLMHVELSGPVNLVAPQPVMQREFARTLGRVLHRPAFAPMPGFAARIAFGQMADEMLLAGAQVAPTRLRQTGFSFRDPALEDALRWCLGRMNIPDHRPTHT